MPQEQHNFWESVRQRGVKERHLDMKPRDNGSPRGASIYPQSEFYWNEIDENDLDNEKHDEQRISTLDGITIDWRNDEENANDSIRVNRDFDSNEMEESDLQFEKHSESQSSIFQSIEPNLRSPCLLGRPVQSWSFKRGKS
jgi:hypothetical protein